MSDKVKLSSVKSYSRNDFVFIKVVRWPSGLRRRTCDWVIPFTPLCQCLSDETLKALGPFYLVSMPGEVKDAVDQSALGMCNLSRTPPLLQKDNSSIKILNPSIIILNFECPQYLAYI